MMRLSYYGDPFSIVAERLNLLSRVITAQEWILVGSDRDEVLGLLHDLERDVLLAIEQNEADADETEAHAA